MRFLSHDEVRLLVQSGGHYRRVGPVDAVVLEAPTMWRTARGDQMVGSAGDWLVRDGMAEWVVAGHLFGSRYVEGEDGSFWRKGTVRAVRLCEDVHLMTLEGRATGLCRDWLAVGDDGDAWVIDAAHFADAYRPG